MTEDEEYEFFAWLDDSRTASEVLDMVREVGYTDAMHGLWADWLEWKKALEEAMADDERHPCRRPRRRGRPPDGGGPREDRPRHRHAPGGRGPRPPPRGDHAGRRPRPPRRRHGGRG